MKATCRATRSPKCAPTKERSIAGLRSFIQEGIEDGSIAPCDPKIAAFSIAGALNWICMWYEPEGALSPEEIATPVRAHVDAGAGRAETAQQVRA